MDDTDLGNLDVDDLLDAFHIICSLFIIVGILNISKRSFPDPVSSGFDLGVLRESIGACMAICARLPEDFPLKTIMKYQI